MKRKNVEQSQADVEPAGEQQPNEPAAAQAELPSQPPATMREPGDDGDDPKFPPEPNPRSWSDNSDAGVKFRTRREPYQAEIAFKDKPSQPVLDLLKDNGFRWDGNEKAWIRPVKYVSQAQDRLVALNTYRSAVNMIRDEKGLAREPQKVIPF